MSKLQELKAEADMMNVKYSKNITYKGLQKLMREAGEERESQISDEEDKQEEPQNATKIEDFIPKEEELKPINLNEAVMMRPGMDTSKIKIHNEDSDYEKMGYDFTGLDRTLKAKVLIRCIIMNLDPEKVNEPSISKTIWNSKGKIAGRVINLGVETHVEKCLLDYLQTQTYQQKTEVKVEGRSGENKDTIIRTKEVPRFAIQILPKLTREELKQLADDQRKSGRLAEEE